MKILVQQHFQQTKRTIKKIPKKDIAKRLLEKGFYPESYILPPCFKISRFDFKTKPFFEVKKKDQ